METKKVMDMEEYQVQKCTWSLEKSGLKNPHRIEPTLTRKKIHNDVIELISNSPMVRLNRIPKSMGIKCDIVAKCEFMLPGGSVKDRIGRRMIEDAELNGTINNGSTIIEATSGNTGIGLALTGAVKGYDVLITLPDKMSQEKNDVLTALGAKVFRTPTNAVTDGPDSHFGVSRRLNKEIENSVILDQYINPGNATAHYDHTAEEIWDQCDGKIDYIVIGVGTGGTITGIARKLKEKNKDIQVVGVDPLGSVLAHKLNLEHPENVQVSYKVEGIGYDFFPKNFDFHVVDRWIKSNDRDTFRMCRRLIREEGLLVGGSAGSVMCAALEVSKDLPADKRVVALFSDSVRNYMTKFLNNDWMLENGFYTQEEYDNLNENKYVEDKTFGRDKKISELTLDKVTPVTLTSTLKQVSEAFNAQNTECVPVVDEKNELVGIYNLRLLTSLLTQGKFSLNSLVQDSYIKESYKVLTGDDQVSRLSKSFGRHQHVVVRDKDSFFIAEAKHVLNAFLK